VKSDNPVPEPVQLIKTREVMKMIGAGRTTIYRWMDAGKFPRPIKIGIRGDNRWPLSDVKEWISRAKCGLTIAPELNGTERNRRKQRNTAKSMT
jgi:prophage regulatory protein